MADGLSDTVFEVASRFCSELTTVIGLPFIIVLAVLLQSLRCVSNFYIHTHHELSHHEFPIGLNEE